ncbi:hypothetical protein [Thermocatellispora tengchongensis]
MTAATSEHTARRPASAEPGGLPRSRRSPAPAWRWPRSPARAPSWPGSP